jgi:hypothetical protein
MKFSNRSIRWFKSVVFSASLVPVFMLAWRAAHRHLGANPVEELTHVTGDWTLRFIVITLLISPFRSAGGNCGADPVSPDGWIIWILLRQLASVDLSLPRQVFRLA